MLWLSGSDRAFKDVLSTAGVTRVLPPGVGAKLYGVLNSLEPGMCGRVGAADSRR